MSRRSFLAAVLGAGAVLVAACSQGDGTTIGPPEAGSPAVSASTGPSTSASAAEPSPTGAGTTAAGIAYEAGMFDVPLQTAGWATVHVSVPAGWSVTTATGGGPLYASAAATFDRRDPSGAMLVRFHFEPNTTGTEEGAFQAAITGYKALRGAQVTVTKPPYRGADSGLTQADWTVRLPVDGKPKLVLVRGWLLDNQVITAYVSVPAGSEATAAQLFAHATDLTYELHSGASPTPAAG